MTTIESILLAIALIQNGGLPKEPPPEPKPIERPERPVRKAVHGWAAYYAYRRGQAAAGPALRRLLGPGYRGDSVKVCLNHRCVRVTVTDHCACGPRKGMATVIDLDSRTFRRLAPLSRGIIEVTVSR